MRRSTLVWIAVILVTVAAAGVTMRAYGPQIRRWMIHIHGGHSRG